MSEHLRGNESYMPAGNQSGSVLAASVTDVTQAVNTLIDPVTIALQHDPDAYAEYRLASAQQQLAVEQATINLAATETQLTEVAAAQVKAAKIKAKSESSYHSHRQKPMAQVKSWLRLPDRKASELRRSLNRAQSDEATQRRELDELQLNEQAIVHDLESATASRNEVQAAFETEQLRRPLSLGEKQALLKPEVLAGLTMEQYITMWRRLNPQFLAHVTRQGFRDHDGHSFHTDGAGRFWAGFTGMMENGGTLQTQSSKLLPDVTDEAAVKAWVDTYGPDTPATEDRTIEDEQLDWLQRFTYKESIVPYPLYTDFCSVHMSAEYVADLYYGSETGNETFYIFPTDFIASQHAYGITAIEGSLQERPSDPVHNNIFVWPDTYQSGIDINAGIVFLPKSTPVDPETGSRYASEIVEINGEPTRVRIENTAAIEAITSRLSQLEPTTALGQLNHAMRQFRYDAGNHSPAAVQELCEMGLSQQAADSLLPDLILAMGNGFDFSDAAKVKRILDYRNCNWASPQETVPAQEYWETYFSAHPERRPKHVHYYEGEPTKAVEDFRAAHGIGANPAIEHTGKLLGMDANLVTDFYNDPRANVGRQALIDAAKRTIRSVKD